MKEFKNDDCGNLIPLLMNKCFEKYFVDSNHPNRIEKLIGTILVREGFKEIHFLRFLEPTRRDEDDGFGVVDVECLCDGENFNIEVTTSYKEFDADNSLFHLLDVHTRDIEFSYYRPTECENYRKSIQICLNMTGIDYDQFMLRSDNTNIVCDDSYRILTLNTLYYLDKLNDDIECATEMDKIIGMFVINDYDKLSNITNSIEEYKDLADILKSYSNNEDILSDYDVDKFLNNKNEYESSEN